MKRLIILSLLNLSISLYLQSQTINISDENFKRKLIQNGVDTNNDGKIDKEEALKITDLFLVWDAFNDSHEEKINNINGIEFFENLESLYIGYNSIDSFNLVNNKKLKLLSCEGNEFKYLSLSPNSILEELYISGNNLKKLELPKLNSLVFLDISSNELTEITLPKLIKLVTLDASGNNISSIPFDSLPNIIHLSLNGNLFPNDFHFKIENNNTLQYLSVQSNLTKLSIINTKIKSLLCGYQLDEINFEGNDSLVSLTLSSDKLKEINFEGIKNVREIGINCKLIDTLDLQQLNKLISLNCGSNLSGLKLPPNTFDHVNVNNNLLKELDLSNTNIRYLYCSNNFIDSLNTSHCSELNTLECDNNNMTNLIMDNTKFEYLNCSKNNYKELDFTSLSNLISAVVYEVPFLEKICVWAMPYSPSKIHLDRHDIVITDCANNLEINAGINTAICENNFEEDSTIILGVSPSVSIEYKDLFWTIDYKVDNKHYDEYYFLDDPKIINPKIINRLGSSGDFYAVLNVLGLNDVLYKDSISVAFSKYICHDEYYYMKPTPFNYLETNCRSQFSPYSVVWSPNYCILDTNATSPMIWPIEDTTYFYTITDDVGCLYNGSVKVIVNGNGITNQEICKWKIYPNPVCSELIIKNSLYSKEDIVFQIFNSNGNLLKTAFLKQTTTSISTQNLPRGMYFYRIMNDGIQLDKGTFVKE